MKRLRWVPALLALTLVAAFLPLTPASPRTNAPRIPLKDSTSSNWAGYAVETSFTSPQSGAVTYVSGTWTVPAVTATAGDAYSSVWVGIDGNDSNTVEQIGTEQDWIGGEAVYYAWFEMYPKFGYLVPLTIAPGDTITASVSYTGAGNFLLTLDDLSDNLPAFSITQKSPSAKRSSAEWIVEAPWSGGVLPLADFGTARFTNCESTLDAVTGPIGAFPYDPIDMTTADGVIKAQTGKLRGKDSFTVKWLAGN